MNSIYDETYMGGYRTPFNTILERGVRRTRKTVETRGVVYKEEKRKNKRKVAKDTRRRHMEP